MRLTQLLELLQHLVWCVCGQLHASTPQCGLMAFVCPCGTFCSIWCHVSWGVCALPLVCNKHVGLRHICLVGERPCSAAVHHFHPQQPHPPPAVPSQSLCTHAHTPKAVVSTEHEDAHTPWGKLPLFEWVQEPAVLSALSVIRFPPDVQRWVRE